MISPFRSVMFGGLHETVIEEVDIAVACIDSGGPPGTVEITLTNN